MRDEIDYLEFVKQDEPDKYNMLLELRNRESTLFSFIQDFSSSIKSMLIDYEVNKDYFIDNTNLETLHNEIKDFIGNYNKTR